MAKTYTKQERDERYERLPQVLKEALFSADIAEKMFALGKKYALTMEKIGFMSEEAGFVVLGLTPPRAFASALAERLQIPADAAEKIALEISHEIFFPLREALKETHQIEVGEGAMMAQEVVKKAPALSHALTNDLTKDIAPLIDGLRNGRPAGFLPQKEIEKIITEKQTGIKNEELRMRNEQETTALINIESQAPMPSQSQSKNAIDLRAFTPPPAPIAPPAVPINPKIPPIDLRPAPQKEPRQTQAPAPEKTKPYQGYDPYREPIE